MKRQATKVTEVKEVNLAFFDSKIPEFKKVLGQKYIKFGDDDKYLSYLLDLYNKSAKHRAIINGKVKYIFGGGLSYDGADPKTDQFIKSFPSKQCLTDVEVFGGFYLQIIPTVFTGTFSIYHIPFDKIRKSDSGNEYFFKDDWSKTWGDLERFDKFQHGCKTTSIFEFKEYNPLDSPYALPGYIAACNYIESDVQVSKATLTNAKGGFSATKFINFYNGEPEEEDKRKITSRFEGFATGSEGKKILLGFNNDPDKRPTIDNLGESDLTKEDFTQVDNLITNNIFTAHEITHPLLFGIQQAGKLGSSAELRIAFDIFKNTYVNNKQEQFDKIVNYFARLKGIVTPLFLTDVDPIGFEFSDQVILTAAPRSWILEKMGIDSKLYPDTPALDKTGTPPIPIPTQQETMVNEHLKNLTGKQSQQLDRIVRKFNKGDYTIDQAKAMMKAGFGLSDDDINTMLGASAFSDELADDNFLTALFEAHGESMDGYEIRHSKPATFTDDDETYPLTFWEEVSQWFKESPETATKGGVTKGGGGGIKKVISNATKLIVRYSYEKRDDVGGQSILSTSRPFCRFMVAQSKFYSREDINKISAMLGYNVFKQVGGFWNNNGNIESHCRHIWKANVVTKI